MQKETRKTKIFIFDDHDSVRESYVRWLGFEGYQVLGGEKSLKNCLELLKKHHPGIVLLDIDYPEEEVAGIKAAKKIAGELPSIKTIFVSHYIDSNIIAKAFASGAGGYFAKSDELKFLKEVIDKVSEDPLYVPTIRQDGSVWSEVMGNLGTETAGTISGVELTLGVLGLFVYGVVKLAGEDLIHITVFTRSKQFLWKATLWSK